MNLVVVSVCGLLVVVCTVPVAPVVLPPAVVIGSVGVVGLVCVDGDGVSD